MSTNYYHVKDEVPACPKCGAVCATCHEQSYVHIGKAAIGWTFSFHATDTIRSYSDWLKALEAGGHIEDEYRDTLTLEEFRDMVSRQAGAPRNHAALALTGEWGDAYAKTQFLDPEGHSFSEREFS